MKSLTLEPAGADRCWIMRHLFAFFGTTPRPEQCRAGNGRWWKGPWIQPASTSFCSSASTTCCSCVQRGGCVRWWVLVLPHSLCRCLERCLIAAWRPSPCWGDIAAPSRIETVVRGRGLRGAQVDCLGHPFPGCGLRQPGIQQGWANWHSSPLVHCP